MYNLCDDVMYYIEMSFVEPRCNILNHVYVCYDICFCWKIKLLLLLLLLLFMEGYGRLTYL